MAVQCPQAQLSGAVARHEVTVPLEAAQVCVLVDEAPERLGEIRHLVHVAGAVPVDPLEDLICSKSRRAQFGRDKRLQLDPREPAKVGAKRARDSPRRLANGHERDHESSMILRGRGAPQRGA